MANVLTNIMPKILARALISLRTRCIMPRLVNSDYSIDAAKKGSTIDVPVPVAVATIPVTPSNVLVAPGDLTPAVVQISLDQWRQNTPIGLTDNELTQIDENDNFLPMQLMEAIKALASDVNQHIVGKYKGTSRGVYGFISNPNDGTATAILEPFGSGVLHTSGVSAATNAKKVLNQQLCPRSDRRGLLNFDAEAAALDLSAFSDAEKIMSAVVKMEGEIGRKFGIDWVADDDVPDHTCGTAYMTVPADVTIKAAEAIGSETIGLVDASAGTIVQGDIITIAGDSQTYCVIGGTAGSYTLHAVNAVEVGIYPALKTTLSGAEVVSIKNSHSVNMVFHRDAFAFATRPLLANSADYSLGSKMLSMQDPVTGLVLRLEVSRQHKQTVWEFDLLWGADLVRPELAMRIAGAV